MSNHGSVEAVLRHDGALSPALGDLAPFSAPVLEPNLFSWRQSSTQMIS